MSLSPAAVSSPEEIGARRAISLLTAFCDGMSASNPKDWSSDLFENILEDLRITSGLDPAAWCSIANVLVSFLIMLDWSLEGENKFQSIAYMAQLLQGSLGEYECR